MGYIPDEALPNLHRYKYGGVDKSLVSRYILSKYWNALVQLFPLWIAPNLITLLGLLCVVANVSTLMYYAPDLGPCPNWVYYTFGIGLFTYQSLDAIDGKQARRTGMSGPLGELFDHGCDALNTSLGVLTWASATGLGQSWWTVMSLVASLGNFYLSTWEEYHTGILYLGYFSGPVEGVLMLVAVHMVSGYYGPSFWSQRMVDVLPMVEWVEHPIRRMISGIQLNHVLIIVGSAVLVFNIISALVNVIAVKYTPTDYSHEDRSIGKALLGLLPFVFIVGAICGWLYLWPSLVYEHLALFILFTGLLFGHQVGVMITSHVAKLNFPYLNVPVFTILAAGCVLAAADTLTDINPNAINQRVALKAFLGMAALQYASLVQGIINQICTYLGIQCLTVKKKTKQQ